MILYPAIDLKDGQCVRLLYGDMDKATVFNASPPTEPPSSPRPASSGCTWSTLTGPSRAMRLMSRR